MSTINLNKEIVEVPLEEYDAIKAVASGIADQNQSILVALKSMSDSIVAVSEMLGRMIETAYSAPVINVNVPEQPAPVVNFSMPEMPPAKVEMHMPPEKEKKIKMEVKRNRDGAIVGFEGTEK